MTPSAYCVRSATGREASLAPGRQADLEPAGRGAEVANVGEGGGSAAPRPSGFSRRPVARLAQIGPGKRTPALALHDPGIRRAAERRSHRQLADTGELTGPALREITMAKPSSYTTGWTRSPCEAAKAPPSR
ncbi:MAG: hypothetical protein JWQ97_2961 [Phenylobacterium sp.]|nr:hypothetical protein [Phenylobacterium sp.]